MIINNLVELEKIISELKDNNSKIGCITGSFDLLHDGHKEAIKFSKENCDKLIVLVNSDQSIKKYKGPTRPIESENKRIENLNNLYNDCYFFLFDYLIPNILIEIIKPNIYFLSGEWVSSPVEKLVIDKYGGEIKPHPTVIGESTTKYIHKDSKSKRAIFLDRDGTINEDFGYIDSTEKIEIKKTNLDGLVKMAYLDFSIFVVTNQSGVSKGLFTEKKLKEINNHLVNVVHVNGGRIDKVYYDTSDSSNPSSFRKPNTGMVEKAVNEFGISLSKSWIIGDKDTDIELGKFTNLKTIYVMNKKYPYKFELRPDFTVSNLVEAYSLIKEHS